MTAQHVARDIRRSRTRLPSFETWQAEWETIYPTLTPESWVGAPKQTFSKC
jgi:hypothetical protein